MIDAFNQIKKEEEENRNSLKKEFNNKEKGTIIFNKSIQESINRYQPSESGTSLVFSSIMSGYMKNNKNNESNLNSLVSISLNKLYPLNNKIIINEKNANSKKDSFEFDNSDITQNSENSLINIVQILNKKNENWNENKNENNYLKKNSGK